jgi:hypothetical protein
MPCVYYETEQEKAENAKRALEQKIEPYVAQVEKHKKELDKATSVACKLLKLIEDNNIEINDKELKSWAVKHKKQDELRIKNKKG